ncbi:MAG: hypothetical protein JXA96_14955 [Sedimentisphaerales bacterium]|nr:hypothetical protein [Sedimentisphaerales bacterium]
MDSFHEYMIEYKKQMAKGAIPKAYKGLMEYIMSLRTYFKNKYPDYSVSGNIYYGYMDMTYFSFFPDSLKKRKLKAGIVFLHETFKFEVWLFGYNKQIQTKYWEMLKDNGWSKYHLVPTTKGNDSILEYTLADNPDFSDLNALTKQIEQGTLKFIRDVEDFFNNPG